MATTVLDEENVDVGTTPTLYCNQPPNKLLCRLAYAGAELASAFTVGGTLAAYVKIVKPADDPIEYNTHGQFAATEFWLAATGVRMPDSLAGVGDTITLAGPSGATTLNPTIVSSQGRPTTPLEAYTSYRSTRFALITTECWLRFLVVKSRSDTYWQGVPEDAVFAAGDGMTNPTYVVSSAGTLNAKLASLAVGSGQKYRIVCTDPTGTNWNSGPTISTSKNFLAGGGYCQLVPDPAAPPVIRNRWFITGSIQGLERRGFQHPGSYPTLNDLCISISGLNCQVVLDGDDYTDPNWSQDNTYDGSKLFIKVTNAELIRIKNCKFVGGKRNILLINCRMMEVSDNSVSQTVDDFADWTFDGKHLGRWPDNDLCFWLHHNRVNNLMNKNTGLHLDVSQRSKSLAYPAGDTDYSSNYPATDVTLGEARLVSGQFIQCSIAGKTAAHATTADIPIPTAGSPVTDGTAQWTWISSRPNMPKVWIANHDNVLVSGGDHKGGDSGTEHPGAQFFINSDSGAICPFAIFNNLSATSQQRGVNFEASSQVERNYVELNTFVGPHEQPIAPADWQDQEINSFAPFGKMRAYKNICAEVQSTVFSEGNIIVKGKTPPAGKAYWENCRSLETDFADPGDGVKRFTIQDDGADTFDDTRDTMSRLFHPLVGNAGARAPERHFIQFRVRDANGVASNIIEQTWINLA